MKLDLTPIWYQEVDLVGVVGHDIVSFEGENLPTFELAMRWLMDGRLQTSQLLTHQYPLAEYREAFAVAVDKRGRNSIKVAFQLV